MAANRFDGQADWVAYDAPIPGDPNDSWSDASDRSSVISDKSHTSNGSSGSHGSQSSGKSSIPGPYIPPNRRGGTHDGVLANEDGQVARVSPRGNLKVFGAPYDKSGAFRKIQRIGYALNADQLKFLQGRFPNTYFHVEKDRGHDHPIAHTETLIANRHALDSVRDGCQILDVFGNPRATRTFNARRDLRGRAMTCMVSLATERDYLRRATKWGPQFDAQGQAAYHELSMPELLAPENADWLNGFDVFLFSHTAYYVTPDDLVELLSRKVGSLAKLIIHRHPLEQGKLFGEIDYTNRRGMVVQRNIETGERYVHQSMEWLFSSTTKVWRNSRGGLVWSFNKVSVDTWIIDMCYTPNNLDERFNAYARQSSPAAAADRMNREESGGELDIQLPTFLDADVTHVAGVTCIKVKQFNKPLRITNKGYFDFLAASVVGKKRDDDVLQDLFALARRENTLTSQFPGAKRFEVPVDEVADHVVTAFISGIPREVELLTTVTNIQGIVRQHADLVTGKAVDVSTSTGKLKVGVQAAREINEVRRAKDPIGAILDRIEKRI